MDAHAGINVLLALLLAPLLAGIINKTKAAFAGRTGQPYLQLYADLFKLLRKGATYSRTTTWIFRAGPVVGLAASMLALALLPFGGAPALLAFPGDFLVLIYLLGLVRFATALAALDTGSSFEGMGGSREVQFSALSEPALLLAIGALALQTGAMSLSVIFGTLSSQGWAYLGPGALIAAALLIVFLQESGRMPVDDPNTHLELTMIHEVMVLDHGGPDLAFILYGSALRMWVLGSLVVNAALPFHTANPFVNTAGALAGLAALAILVGIIESTLARLRLVRVPRLLISAGVLSVLALVLILR